MKIERYKDASDNKLTIHFGRYFGVCFSKWPGYLCAVIWYPRGRRRLGHLYPSIRWPF
jgi:hypothetical protein